LVRWNELLTGLSSVETKSAWGARLCFGVEGRLGAALRSETPHPSPPRPGVTGGDV